MSRHTDRVGEVIVREAAQFIKREAGTESLITVTRFLPAAHGERITVFVSVFPEERTRTALIFLEEKRKAFSDHLKEHTRLHPLPRVDFLPDSGEKNRQRLEELSKDS